MIERLVPDSVAVVFTREDLADVELFPEEEASVARAVEKRRREFTNGRGCARLALERLGVALERLGVAPVVIPEGARGEPLWPSGVVGSITHCHGYCAAAVARAGDVLSIGIDAEVHAPLPEGVLKQIAFDRELAMVADRSAGVHLDRLLFSAKEAVYKAWFPLAKRWLGFEDADVTIDLGDGTFRALLLVPGPLVGGAPLTELSGRWAVDDGIVAAAITLLP